MAPRKVSAEVRSLIPADALALTRLMTSASPEYLRFFRPFEFTAPVFEQQIRRAKADLWWGLESEGQLAGFFMLRGFDEGYARPSFGVFVGEQFAGRGLARLALRHAVQWCERNRVARIMLKVHPENRRARDLYIREGFDLMGLCPQTGQEMREKVLASAAA